MKTNYQVEVVIDGRTVKMSSENPSALHSLMLHLSCSCYSSKRYNDEHGYVSTAEQDGIDAENFRNAALEIEEAMDI